MKNIFTTNFCALICLVCFTSLNVLGQDQPRTSDVALAEYNIGEVSLESSTVLAGATLTSNFRIFNSGNEDGVASTTKVYLSTKSTPTVDDIELLSLPTPAITSDNYWQFKDRDLIIPANTPQGNYYIIFVADTESEVDESDELNNYSSIALEVTTATAIEDENFSSGFTLYPNPASEWINIVAAQESVSLVLKNLNGVIVKEQNSLTRDLKLFVGELPEGIYLLTITTGNTTETRKVVIR